MSETPSAEQKTIYNVYAVLGVSIALSVVPHVSAALLCTIFFMVALGMAYGARKKAEEHSLSENHMTYIIRTIWISALLASATMIAASLYMMPRIDYLPFEVCANNIAGVGIEALEAMTSAELYAHTQPCVEDFIHGNYQVFMTALMIAGLPVLLYLGYRFAKGLSRALKGYRLADPKSWI